MDIEFISWLLAICTLVIILLISIYLNNKQETDLEKKEIYELRNKNRNIKDENNKLKDIVRNRDGLIEE